MTTSVAEKSATARRPSAAPRSRPKGNSSTGDKIFNAFTVGVLSTVMLGIIYPLYFIVVASVSDPNLIQQGKVWLLPGGFTLEGYQTLFRDEHCFEASGTPCSTPG